MNGALPDDVLDRLMRAKTRRGRHAPGAQVIVLDRGPNFGRPARIESLAAPGNGEGYWMRFEGENIVRSAFSVEAAP